MINAMIIDARDNVGVATEAIQKDAAIHYLDQRGRERRIVAREDIQIYHKFAAADIEKDAPIVKYGEHIGAAAADLRAGCHVHVHNVKSVRENL